MRIPIPAYLQCVAAEVVQASQQQGNGSDCGIYMIYNADCLASNPDTMGGQMDGIGLRYRYLGRLVELERQGSSERQIMEMVFPPNETLERLGQFFLTAAVDMRAPLRFA